jgi:uncharacterized protein involved in exopolysaccharide biosynthesis
VAADRATGWTTSPPAAPVPVAAGPDLQTVGRSLPDKGVVLAIGVLFLAVALGGVALVRRHARRRA